MTSEKVPCGGYALCDPSRQWCDSVMGECIDCSKLCAQSAKFCYYKCKQYMDNLGKVTLPPSPDLPTDESPAAQIGAMLDGTSYPTMLLLVAFGALCLVLIVLSLSLAYTQLRNSPPSTQNNELEMESSIHYSH